MAEGDSVRRLADRLHSQVAGATVTGCVVRHNRYANSDLSGASIETIDAAGKHVLMRLTYPDGAAVTVHSHLRMSGRWTIGVPSRVPVHRRRIELQLDDGRRLVGTDLPVLHIGRRADERLWIGHLGPDLCAPTFDAAMATTNLSADARPLGQALLDQRVLAGIGNLYAVELPFLVAISPWTPACDIPGVDDLVRLARALLVANVEIRQQSTTGLVQRRTRHWIYGRDGWPCHVCGTRVRHDPAPPWTRDTWWCDGCQRGPGVDLVRVRHLLRRHRQALRRLDGGSAIAHRAV